MPEEIEEQHYGAQGRLASMSNYYRWTLRNFGGAIGQRVWDSGAGIGTVTDLLLERADFVLATEYSQMNIKALEERYAQDGRVEVGFCDLTDKAAEEFASRQLDTVITLDVLEHIEDDRAVLDLYHRVLQPGGKLLIKVPAHPFLYGSLDEVSLHFRRYRKQELREKLEAAGFKVTKLRHMNMAATVPYWLKGRVLKKKTNFSNAIDGNKLGFYNRLMPWLERAERVLPCFFGLSLIAVSEKRA